MKDRVIKKYQIKKLIKGEVINFPNIWVVAIPDKKLKDHKIQVCFGKQMMLIKNWHKALAFRRFHDMYGGKDYTLAYHEWKPKERLI